MNTRYGGMCAVGVADADGRTAAALLPSEGVVLRGEETLRTPLDMVSASHYQVLVILHRGQVRLHRFNLHRRGSHQPPSHRSRRDAGRRQATEALGACTQPIFMNKSHISLLSLYFSVILNP